MNQSIGEYRFISGELNSCYSINSSFLWAFKVGSMLAVCCSSSNDFRRDKFRDLMPKGNWFKRYKFYPISCAVRSILLSAILFFVSPSSLHFSSFLHFFELAVTTQIIFLNVQIWTPQALLDYGYNKSGYLWLYGLRPPFSVTQYVTIWISINFLAFLSLKFLLYWISSGLLFITDILF